MEEIKTYSEKIKDFACRLIVYAYDYENCEKADLNDLEISKDIFIDEFNELFIGNVFIGKKEFNPQEEN